MTINKQAALAAITTNSIPNFKLQLRQFQLEGIKYAIEKGTCFIADEMGLGKTIQAIAAVQVLDAYPALIVCPASLKFNWRNEINKCVNRKVFVIKNGSLKAKEKVEFDAAEIIIINYDVLKKHSENLNGKKFQAVVYDESHYCKNYKAARTKAAKEIAKEIPFRFCLTGTPILNRPQELLSQLDMLGRINDLGGFWHFAKRYCDAHQIKIGRNQFIWDFSGAKNLVELNAKLRQTCLVRRLKKDVLTELPDKIRQDVSVELSNKNEYQKAERELISYLRDKVETDKKFLEGIENESEEEQKKLISERKNDVTQKAIRAQILVSINTLRQVAAQGKLESLYEFIEETCVENNEKLLVFCEHTAIIDAIVARFNCKKIDGSVASEKRQAIIDEFQNDSSVKLLALNTKAGGVGYNLTEASRVAFIEFPWTPSLLNQAEDRAHRMGQKDCVNVYNIVASGTIDAYMINVIERKRSIVNATLDGAEITEEKMQVEDESMINEIIDIYMGEAEKTA